jgi:hypothetical protein
MKDVVEIYLDMDRLPKGVGHVAPSGHVDFDSDDVRKIVDWAETRITQNYPVAVTLRGRCPHYLLVQLVYLIVATENVVRFDFVPIGNPKITVFEEGVSA